MCFKLRLVLDPWLMSLNLFDIILFLLHLKCIWHSPASGSVFIVISVLLLDSVLLFRDNIE